MSYSVQPHRRQPTWLPRPWDSFVTEVGVRACTCARVCVCLCLSLRQRGKRGPLQPSRVWLPLSSATVQGNAVWERAAAAASIGREGNGTPLQYSCLENSMDGGAWQAAVHGGMHKLLQSCPTLCNPIDGSPPGSPVPEILQARTLECQGRGDPRRRGSGFRSGGSGHMYGLASPLSL